MVPVVYRKFIATITFICFNRFSFPTPNSTNCLKFLGEAHIDNIASIRLTRGLLVPTSGAGRVLYYKPVTLRNNGKQNTPTSFNTSFSFIISTLNPNSIGGGLAFVMSSNNKAIGNAGGNLGILPGDDIAVELDTFKDDEFNDINGNHVGVNIDSMISKQVFNLDTIGVSLRSGKVVHSWIDYSGSRKQLDVFISYSKTKPMNPLLSIGTIDLYQHLGNNMFVGFSASTEGSTEMHRIISWKFTSFFESESLGPLWCPPPSSMPPTMVNTTPTDSYISTGLITSSPTQTKCHDLLCILGVTFGGITAIIIALLAYWKKDSVRIRFNNYCCSINHNHNHIYNDCFDEKV